ncbi:hypothetical protein, partial [Aquisphaera insulae]|uniref:hypothetical protein n=1 Tax=Aquisphaera insulae TaxID=2712864 RepID=UPI00196A5C45
QSRNTGQFLGVAESVSHSVRKWMGQQALNEIRGNKVNGEPLQGWTDSLSDKGRECVANPHIYKQFTELKVMTGQGLRGQRDCGVGTAGSGFVFGFS